MSHPSVSIQNHGHESEINNLKGKKSTYIEREPLLQLLLSKVLDMTAFKLFIILKERQDVDMWKLNNTRF